MMAEFKLQQARGMGEVSVHFDCSSVVWLEHSVEKDLNIGSPILVAFGFVTDSVQLRYFLPAEKENMYRAGSAD
jgi:hypothetical protein